MMGVLKLDGYASNNLTAWVCIKYIDFMGVCMIGERKTFQRADTSAMDKNCVTLLAQAKIRAECNM